MAQPVIQHSFHAGEWAPNLNARVDLQKYHSGAELLRNFFVDYRGGASTCPGTKYVLQTYKSATAVRLIPFQASANVTYVLEFGDAYIRFFTNGGPVLESGLTITNVATNVITVANSYVVGDWVYVTGVNGITNVNGNYYIISAATGTNITVTDLFGGTVSFSGTYTSGGTVQRVYTLPSPYAAADVFMLKFAQDVNTMIIVHNSYPPNLLTIVSANNWTINPIQFGPTLSAPTGVNASTTNSGSIHIAYVVTAVDVNGRESAASSVATTTVLSSGNAGSSVSWTALSGAVAYNVYRAPTNFNTDPPTGSMFGYLNTVTGTSFSEVWINGGPTFAPDFSSTPPIVDNPFQGGSVASVAITTAGSYTGAAPTITFTAAPSGGATATAIAYLGVTATGTISASDTGFAVGNLLTPTGSNTYGGLTLRVTTVDGSGHVTGVAIVNPGSSSNVSAASPTKQFKSGSHNVTVALTWGVISIVITFAGTGYTSVPTVSFSSGTAAATATLNIIGNPSVVSFFDQRAVFAAPPTAVNTLYFSQPGAPYNFDVSQPTQADDAITASLRAKDLNSIRSMVPMSAGLITFADKGAWLINGGSQGQAVDAINVTAHAQAYNGASDLAPIVVNFDVIYNQAKGSYVRDLTFNYYTQIYTGTDISVLSSHLFYGFQLLDWAYAEEPFKMIHAVRDDGQMLLLTFLKEQEIIGWSHRDTQGSFKSVCSVVETVTLSNGETIKVDAVYVVVQRTINAQTLQYIERVAERIFPGGVADAWCVDAGIQYSGSPATSFSGGQHLAGATVTGLADGAVIPPFAMPTNGSFTLEAAASKVTVGLSFTPQLKTLRLDLGEPTAQGKRKKVTAVTVRCQETLGLSIGRSFSSLTPMKDLVVGNVGTMSNQVVTGLVTDDVRTVIDPLWDVPGQYCIQQSNPWPASILGVIPEIVVGDAAK